MEYFSHSCWQQQILIRDFSKFNVKIKNKNITSTFGIKILPIPCDKIILLFSTVDITQIPFRFAEENSKLTPFNQLI